MADGSTVATSDHMEETLIQETPLPAVAPAAAAAAAEQQPPATEPGATGSSSPPQPPAQQPQLIVGGCIKEPAICVLDGTHLDSNQRITLPITRVPCLLGRVVHDDIRSHDPNFVPLGMSKGFSRKHMQIDYRIPLNNGVACGRIESNLDRRGEFVWDPSAEGATIPTANILKKNVRNTSFPRTGFFSLSCLGKNRITVNKNVRLEPGQSIHIESGATIRVGALALVFLTPTIPSDKTMEIIDETVRPPKRSNSNISNNSNTNNPNKKRKKQVTQPVVSSAIPTVVKSSATATTKKQQKALLHVEVEQMSTQALLDAMDHAVADDIWDRRHQLIGSTIAQRAVVAAGIDLRTNIGDDGQVLEVSRGEIMDWIADSDRYKVWVEQMLTKMQAKSYEASITKALLKYGFTRTATTGRYIKWNIPDDLEENAGGKANVDDGNTDDDKDEDEDSNEVGGRPSKEEEENVDDDEDQDRAEGKEDDDRDGDEHEGDDDQNDKKEREMMDHHDDVDDNKSAAHSSVGEASSTAVAPREEEVVADPTEASLTESGAIVAAADMETD